MARSSPLTNPRYVFGYRLLTEIGEVTTNTDGATSMAAATDHGQTLGTSIGNVIIWRGLTPDVEYVLDFIGATGAAIATTVRYGTSETATVLTGTMLSTGAAFAARLLGRLVVRMPPGHTRLGVYQVGTGGGTVSLFRTI